MRLAVGLLASALGIGPAWAACTPPAVDVASIQVTGVNGGTNPQISTTGPNELILYYAWAIGDTVMVPPTSPAPPVVIAVTDGAGLTWKQRGTVTTYQQVPAQCGGGRCYINEQLWWAYSTAQLTNDTITPTWSFRPPFWAFSAVFGVQNIQNPALPFDSNASLPATNSANLDGASYNVSFTTTFPSDLLLVTCASIAITAPLCDVLQASRPPWVLQAGVSVTNLGGAMYGTVTTLANASPGLMTVTNSEPNWLGVADAIAGCVPVNPHPFVWINE